MFLELFGSQAIILMDFVLKFAGFIAFVDRKYLQNIKNIVIWLTNDQEMSKKLP